MQVDEVNDFRVHLYVMRKVFECKSTEVPPDAFVGIENGVPLDIGLVLGSVLAHFDSYVVQVGRVPVRFRLLKNLTHVVLSGRTANGGHEDDSSFEGCGTLGTYPKVLSNQPAARAALHHEPPETNCRVERGSEMRRS